MANKQVTIYMSGSNYSAFPPFLVEKGGGKIDFVNITGDRVYVMLPEDAGTVVCKEIAAGTKETLETKGQNHPINVYGYEIGKAPCPAKMKEKKTKLDGSDPILILEN